jgi:hypothetical protein
MVHGQGDRVVGWWSHSQDVLPRGQAFSLHRSQNLLIHGVGQKNLGGLAGFLE